MKFRKTLGVLLTLLGCIAAFLGLAAAVVPLVSNAQLQLVLDSFADALPESVGQRDQPTDDFCSLSHSLPVLLGGLLAASAGIAVLACMGPKSVRDDESDDRRPARFSEDVEKQAGLWRSERAKDVLPDNPFATPSAEDGLAASQGGWRGGSFQAIREERANAFAPAVQSHAVSFSSVKSTERSPYQRPEEQERSPYQRPEEPEPFNRSDDSFPAPSVEEEADASPSLSSIFEEDLLFTRSQASQTAAHSEKPAEKAEEPAPDFDLTFESDEAEDSLFFPTVSPEAKSNSESLTTPVIDEPAPRFKGCRNQRSCSDARKAKGEDSEHHGQAHLLNVPVVAFAA